MKNNPTVWPVESSRKNVEASAPHHLQVLKGLGIFELLLTEEDGLFLIR
jgi:hypothetical protein